MIQRTLLRQSARLNSSLRASPRSPLARPQFLSTSTPTPTSFARVSRPAAAAAAARWYSSEPETKKDESAEEKTEDKTAEDKTKLELEAKNKEIVELKVRHAAPILSSPRTANEWQEMSCRGE